MKVMLDESNLYELFRGRVILKGEIASGVEIALSDIGWDRIQACLTAAIRDTELGLTK